MKRTATDTEGAPDGFQQLAAMLAGELKAPMGEHGADLRQQLPSGEAPIAAVPNGGFGGG